MEAQNLPILHSKRRKSKRKARNRKNILHYLNTTGITLYASKKD
jgi:hypothetical protein